MQIQSRKGSGNARFTTAQLWARLSEAPVLLLEGTQAVMKQQGDYTKNKAVANDSSWHSPLALQNTQNPVF